MKKLSQSLVDHIVTYAEGDPGFPLGFGANPPGGRQHINMPDFPKNCMKLRTLWLIGGCPLDPPLQSMQFIWSFVLEFGEQLCTYMLAQSNATIEMVL